MAGSLASNPHSSAHQSPSAVPSVNGSDRTMYSASGASTQTTNGTSNSNSSNVGINRPNGVSNGSDQQPNTQQQQLLHDPGISLEWSTEEQSILDDALTKYAAEPSGPMKYIKIANLLPEKTVRDVAMRLRWMNKKENGKRRKVEEQNGSKKLKDRRDKPDPIAKQNSLGHPRPTILYTPAPPAVDNDDGISNDAIGGSTGQLLEQNSQVIAQIKANFAACKLQENTDLLVKFRDNIFAILNGMTIMPGIMSQMPPLPVKLNTELADTILPKLMPQSSSTSP